MSDLIPIAQDCAAALTPFAPYLGLVVIGARDKLLAAVGEATADWLLGTWHTLRQAATRLGRGHADSLDAVGSDAANTPDEALQGSLAAVISEIMRANTDLAAALRVALESRPTVTDKSARTVEIGGSVQTSTIIAGDKNSIG